jgi:hypothetical protein
MSFFTRMNNLKAIARKYDEDQPRDEKGQFASTGGGGKETLSSSSEVERKYGSWQESPNSFSVDHKESTATVKLIDPDSGKAKEVTYKLTSKELSSYSNGGSKSLAEAVERAHTGNYPKPETGSKTLGQAVSRAEKARQRVIEKAKKFKEKGFSREEAAKNFDLSAKDLDEIYG